jgi:LPS export ABC transporter protein LptC
VTGLFFVLLLLASCTFDYGQQDVADSDQPDIVMMNVEYVRVRSADPLARFKAERAERYEQQQLMKLRNFSFEQFGNHGEDINAFGRAGSAVAEMDTGNIRLADGVRIEVESEDLVIETKELEWKDKERLLLGGETNEVNITQSSGTHFTGVGFQADARRHTWGFEGGVKGSYVYEEKENETGVAATEEDVAE